MKASIKDFFSKCDQIRKKLRICSHLLKKFLMENFIFCAVLLEFCYFHCTKVFMKNFFIFDGNIPQNLLRETNSSDQANI